MGENYTLQMKDIHKEYYGNKVLHGIDLNVKEGEIHALLGENGAGKSTLMNVLFGMPVIHNTGGFDGEVLIDGKSVNIHSPKEAMKYGIGMVHQEFMLIPEYTIAENIKLNREITKESFISKLLGKKAEKLRFLDREQMDKEARESLDVAGLDVEEWVRVKGLPVGYMQFIEIAREIDKENIKLIVFDEPTAVLTESEANNLMETMKRLAKKGISILFITHRLSEVIDAADQVTILRDGKLIVCKPTSETNVGELAELMVGKKIELPESDDSSHILEQEVVLDVNNLSVEMPGEEVHDVSFQVHKGEIYGIGGLAGQGKIGIANGIMGLYPSTGNIAFNGSPLILNDINHVLKKGLAFVSEDRRNIGLLLEDSIEKNIAVSRLHIREDFLKNYGLFKLLDKGHVRKHALEMIEKLDIRCVGPEQHTGRLSGGNQQKVCIARALTLEPQILFVSEPTRGIDIGAKKIVLDLLVELNKELGMTIVMTSSELAELRMVCDRIAIVTEGTIEGTLKPNDSDKNFGLMMAGEYHKTHNKGDDSDAGNN